MHEYLGVQPLDTEVFVHGNMALQEPMLSPDRWFARVSKLLLIVHGSLVACMAPRDPLRQAVDELLPPWTSRCMLTSGLDEDDSTQHTAPRRLMNRHKPLYGQQHMASNLNINTHKELNYFEACWEQLQNLDGLLKMRERRERFLWTCVKGTRFENHIAAKRLKGFKGALYEKKWKYVTKYVGRVLKFLFLLRFTFKARQYTAGVDSAGAAFEQDADSREGDAAFDPVKLEGSMKDGLFLRYLNFLHFSDSIPEMRIAAWSESCICHGALFAGVDGNGDEEEPTDHVNDYARRRLLEKHFGNGVRTCPFSSCVAPEIADGYLFTVLDEAWAEVEAKCIIGETFLRDLPLRPTQYQIIIKDMSIARSSQVGYVRIKNGYYQKLPWFIASLCVRDENRARSNAVKIRDQFNMDPRPPPVHDESTWALMAPGAPFSAELDAFIAGRPRWSCAECFTEEVASTRCWKCAETTSEEKHGRVKFAMSHHHVGGVRVALANRMPMLERYLMRYKGFFEEFMKAFAEVRTLSSVPALFGFKDHPLLSGNRPATWQLATIIPEIIYRMDSDSAFRSLRKQAEMNKKVKQQVAKAERSLEPRGKTLVLDRAAAYKRVMATAVTDHFARTFQPGAHYSLPFNSAGTKAMPLHEYLDIPRTRADPFKDHACADAVALPAPPSDDASSALVAAEVEVDRGDPQVTLFQVSSIVSSRNKVIKLPVGVGRTLRHGEFTITKFENQGTAASPKASQLPSAEAVSRSVHVVGSLGDPDILQEQLLVWVGQSLKFSLPGAVALCSEPALSEVVDDLVSAGAFPASDKSIWPEFTHPEHCRVVNVLACLGLAECEETRAEFSETVVRVRACSTPKCISQLTMQWVLSNPQVRVFVLVVVVVAVIAATIPRRSGMVRLLTANLLVA